ncbi:MAG: Putative aminoacrylate hydrolase RutD [Methanoregula sp. SKADARSKE-2]|nr:MAG: Putative aminoacrylate hydrolase RutD [Methanoregula sp. SKADARSKE-2]
MTGLKLPALVDPTNLYQTHGLTSRVKYCRLIRRNFNGRPRFSVQLILEGTPYFNHKHPIGVEEVGLDIGPSTIAYVGDTTAELRKLCAEIVPDWKATRRLQRKMDRSRRATNQNNYNPNGTVKRGSKIWTKSPRYQKLQQKLAEQNRKLAAHRKSLHGNLANEILATGSKISTERISYRAWQKMFGKSILVRAPSMIVSLIRRKAENAHGHLHEIPTQTTALSQTCHICGAKVKKPLSQRWHNCCGISVQRDLYAAFLAKCCVKSDNNDSFSLDRAKATALWPGVERLLKQAMSRVDQEFSKPTIGRNPVPASFGLGQSQSGSSAKPAPVSPKDADAVLRNPKESCGRAADTREGQPVMKTKPIILILAILTCLVLLAGCTGTPATGQSTCVQPAQPAPVSIAKTPVKYKEVNGVRLAYWEFGSSGEPVLLIEGFGAMVANTSPLKAAWNQTFLGILSSKYHVYAYDHRGMGYSSTNNATPTIPLYADDAAGLITALGYESMHVYGASMGSSTAQQLVLDHPEKVRKLILDSNTYDARTPECSGLYTTLHTIPTRPPASGPRRRQILYGTGPGTASREFRKIPCSLWEPPTPSPPSRSLSGWPGRSTVRRWSGSRASCT